MNDRDMQVLKWVVLLGPIAMQEAARQQGYALAPNRCIAATKTGIKVLRYFGINATPVPCDLTVGNLAWVKWVEGGDLRAETMPDAAWSVHVGRRNTDGPGYNGHVMIRADDMLVDLNFGQVSRPQKGLEVPDATAFPLDGKRMEAFETGDKVVYFDEDGNVAVIIEPTLERRSFKQAKDWQRNHKQAVGLLIRMVKKAVASERASE